MVFVDIYFTIAPQPWVRSDDYASVFVEIGPPPAERTIGDDEIFAIGHQKHIPATIFASVSVNIDGISISN